MSAKFRAIYDGEKIIPEEPLDLPPGTEVVVTITPIVEREEPTYDDSTSGESPTASSNPEDDEEQRYSFFRAARRLAKENAIDLPPDFSSHLDDFLYGRSEPR